MCVVRLPGSWVTSLLYKCPRTCGPAPCWTSKLVMVTPKAVRRFPPRFGLGSGARITKVASCACLTGVATTTTSLMTSFTTSTWTSLTTFHFFHDLAVNGDFFDDLNGDFFDDFHFFYDFNLYDLGLGRTASTDCHT